MAIDNNKSSIENAYLLWKETESKPLYQGMPDSVRRQTTSHLITNILFHQIRGDCWYSKIFDLFADFFKGRILKQVENALAAYKFEILTDSSIDVKKYIWLFEPAENSFTTELRSLFSKHLLQKKGIRSLREKAQRWKEKSKKYLNNPRSLLAHSALSESAVRFPGLKTIVQVIRPLKEKEIQNFTDELLEGEDPVFERGIVRLLGRPDFDAKAPLKDIAKQAMIEVAKEKIREYVKGKDPALQERVLSLLERPDFDAKASFKEILKQAAIEMAKEKTRSVISGMKATCWSWVDWAQKKVIP
jgi:hypothetical protein